MFGDINHFWVFEPDTLNINRKFMNDLEDFNTLDRWDVQSFDKKSNFFKKLIFFITTYDKRVLLAWYMLINDRNIDRYGGVIG